MARKISIFIGGSSEGLKFANKVKNTFEEHEDIECTIWDNNTFQYNESFLDSLSKASIIHDFGIFIATKDDLAQIRDNIEETPRDNVIFEYGLFLGALGNSKTYLLQEEGCKLPSDLNGYTTPRFKRRFTQKDWESLIENMIKDIKNKFARSEIQLLPSTSLAIGYFYSFVARLANHILDNNGCCTLKNSNKKFANTTFEILIPAELSNDISNKAQVYYNKHQYTTEEIDNPKRAFPIRYYKDNTGKELTIVDMPTTLSAIRHAVNLLTPVKSLGINHSKNKIERKELENFKKTIDFLISQDDYTKEIVKTKWVE